MRLRWWPALVASFLALAASPPTAHGEPAPDFADARDLGALTSCSEGAPSVAAWTREQPMAPWCGQTAGRPPDVARILAAARPLDEATVAHVRAIAQDGATKRRRPNVFGLLGDSLTLEPQFLTAFGAGAPMPSRVPDALRDALRVGTGEDGAPRTVLDLFRGVHAYGTLDAFRAPRFAKNGARAHWALEADEATGETPIDAMTRALSPGIALVLFGTNDAGFLIEPLDRVAARFDRDLEAVVTALEARGIVPILATVPRHLHAYGAPDCAPAAERSNARLAIQTNVVGDVIRDVAARRHLPLVDLRDAVEPLVNHGVASDGIHLSFYAKRLGGGGMLDEAGLGCGVNARALATLRMLALVAGALGGGPT